MAERGNCWSITINNPTEADLSPMLPAGWRQTGQMERGAEGTEHYQGMVTTPQVRFTAVKKVFPRAHIEIARDRHALAAYVSKQETRIKEIEERVSGIPTLFEYQTTIAQKWNPDKFQELVTKNSGKLKLPEIALMYVDELVADDIMSGVRGVEFIAVNPMWISSWKKFYAYIIKRDGHGPQVSPSSQSPQPDEA